MNKMRFEDLLAWQRAQDLAVEVYRVFRSSKDFGFRDQICRAAVSVSNNIAEGYERWGLAEFRRFLFIAKGSCGEVRSMLYLADRLGYIDSTEKQKLIPETDEIAKMIGGLIRSANEKAPPRRSR